jgi:iron-sulfur cluster repair protein YtfE (RIC family)
MTETDSRIDTWEMVLAHRAFRREFRTLPALVGAVAPGDTGRAAVVAGHLTDLTGALHHHHAAEDDLLWPVLSRRTGVRAELVRRMENQHAHLHGLLTRIGELMPGWQSRAESTSRDLLAEALTQLSAALDEHLTDEETEVLPLVERHLTEAEWRALMTEGQKAIPKNAKAFVFIGIILAETTPHESALFLRQLSIPVRCIWHAVGPAIYRRAHERLLGTT